MQSFPRIAVVGAGRMGSSLCRWIAASRLPLAAVVSRSLRSARALQRRSGAANSATLDRWNITAEIVLLAVPDDAIAGTAQSLADQPVPWQGVVVLHTSGAQSSALLEPLRRRGAAVGSLHPLMTFPRQTTVMPEGLVFGVEGDARATRAARRLVRRWGGRALVLRPEQKAAWHLAATLACPLSVVPFAAALEVLRRAGLDSAALRTAQAGLLQLLQQTARNLANGPEAAWTGPFARGDVRTVLSHLKVLQDSPALANYYQAAAGAALTLLPSQAPDEIAAALETDKKRARTGMRSRGRTVIGKRKS